MEEKFKTVGDFIKRLKEFPIDWEVVTDSRSGGRIAIEHREINGFPIVAIYRNNGGKFGENPLTEKEYLKRSKEFIDRINRGYSYTSVHGDHRLYIPFGQNDTCYGTHYDPRIIERMVDEGLISNDMVDIKRVKYLS